VQRRAQREDIITVNSVKLCQEGIERVQGVHEENSISSSVKRRVSEEKTLIEFLRIL
jgi:hypothetical protein